MSSYPQGQGVVRRPRRRRPRGCLVPGFIGLLMMMFACGACFIVSIVFPPASLDVLVLGLDSRNGEGVATRTDSIMLMAVQPGRLRVSLLSIPRDLFISVPGYGMQRINTINMLGEMEESGRGPTLVKESITESFSITMERFVRLDFAAFVGLINAVGGVDINVERLLVDTQYPTDDFGVQTVRFEQGWQHMDGERALIYARTRYSDDDYRRAERQQQVLSAFAVRLINPLTWPGVLSVLSTSIETDIGPFDVVMMVPSMLFSAGRFDQLVIDRDYISPGNGYSFPNYNALGPWINERFD